MEFKSVDEILDFAITNEENAATFYTALAGQVKHDGLRKVFETFAKEEKGHKAKLQGIKEGKTLRAAKGGVPDLKISDYLVEEEPGPDMNYQDALILAMKQEKAAFKLYSDLAASTDDENLCTLFTGLAQEEAKHKLKFEIEYEDNILQDN